MLLLGVGTDLQDWAGWAASGVDGAPAAWRRCNACVVTVSSYDHSGPASLVAHGGSTSLAFTI